MERNFNEKQKNEEQKELLESILMLEFEDNQNCLEKRKETIFQIIPELRETDGFEQKSPYHSYDVWTHTIKAIQKSIPNLEVRLALLLHDIGKPYSYQEDNDIRHFKGHPQKSAQMTQEILTRLGYCQKEINDICYLVEHHDELIDASKESQTNQKMTQKLLHIQYCDAYAYAPEYIEKRIKVLDEIKAQLEEKWNKKEDTKKGER